MTDPLGKITEWREITDAVGLTPGPWTWWADTTLRQEKESLHTHPRTVLKAQEDWGPSPEDATFLMEARSAMPALLTAVQNVLSFAEQESATIRATYDRYSEYQSYANAMDDVIDVIRDALEDRSSGRGNCECWRNQVADAWNEGFAAGVNMDLGDREHPPDEYTNPYREEADQ